MVLSQFPRPYDYSKWKIWDQWQPTDPDAHLYRPETARAGYYEHTGAKGGASAVRNLLEYQRAEGRLMSGVRHQGYASESALQSDESKPLHSEHNHSHNQTKASMPYERTRSALLVGATRTRNISSVPLSLPRKILLVGATGTRQNSRAHTNDFLHTTSASNSTWHPQGPDDGPDHVRISGYPIATPISLFLQGLMNWCMYGV
jgi:hypothetical protein